MKQTETDRTEKQDKVSQYVHDFGDQLYDWAFYKTSHASVAEDMVQETFVSAFLNYDKFRGASSPKTWLFSILKNKIIDHYRKNARNIVSQNLTNVEDETANWFDGNNRWKKEFRPMAWDTGNENLLDNPEFESVLSTCIGKLPTTWSSCIQLKYLGEKESQEICQELNITASNLWQILHRAKLHMRNCLEKNWFKA